MDASGSGWRKMAGACEHCNEPSGSIRGGLFIWLSEWLSASQEALLPWVSFLKILVWGPTGKTSCGWENSAKIDLKEIECTRGYVFLCVDWMKIDQDRD
jgi:hypothetical protein